MSEVSIFKGKNDITVGNRELSPLAKSLASATTNRRIQTNTNGTFKRLVNGEQIGNAVRGEINAIIVGALPKVSRVFYKEKFDVNKEATRPDCWSNQDDKPEAAAGSKQHSNCADCPQNVKGSGENGSRACRFQRRIAVLLADDPSGDVYQFNIPAKSLFGKGTGNVHPFESYVKFLLANGESPDGVVTNISYDLNADTMELQFSPLRNISDEEYALVQAAQDKPETKMYTMITVAQASNANNPAPSEPKKEAKITRAAEPDEEEETPEPQKRSSKKTESKPAKQDLAATLDAWGKD